MTIFHTRLVLALAASAAVTGSALAQTAAPARANAVKVSNQTKQAIVSVFASPPGVANWGDDMLGKASLGPGKVLTLKLAGLGPDCMADFSALMANGDTKVQKGVDLCAASPAVQF